MIRFLWEKNEEDQLLALIFKDRWLQSLKFDDYIF